MSQRKDFFKGTRVQLIKEECPGYYHREQSRGDLGVILETKISYARVRWDNGHENSYYYHQIKALVGTNRECLWALKR